MHKTHPWTNTKVWFSSRDLENESERISAVFCHNISPFQKSFFKLVSVKLLLRLFVFVITMHLGKGVARAFYILHGYAIHTYRTITLLA
jgi:hypothetical protein